MRFKRPILRINTMRTCNFFYLDVTLLSGGTTRAGSLMMATGLPVSSALLILKDQRLSRLLYIKSFLPEEQFRRVKDFIESWWKRL